MDLPGLGTQGRRRRHQNHVLFRRVSGLEARFRVSVEVEGVMQVPLQLEGGLGDVVHLSRSFGSLISAAVQT